MKVLLAIETDAGRWSKVLIARNIRRDGQLSLAAKWCGSAASYAVRSAAKHFASDSAVAEVFYKIGGEHFRATKF